MSGYVECAQLVKAFQVGGHEIVALRGIDFEMAPGEMVAIIGPSGAGKSTILNLLGGLDQPTAGRLTVGGQNLLELKGRTLAAYRLQQVGFIWQQVERNLFAHRSSLRNVTLPMMLAGMPVRDRVKRARELLDLVDMLDHADKHPAALSGGQQQRVAIAVALANQPGLLLADEPTGSIDRENAMQVMALLRDLNQRYGLTVLMVTHDLEAAEYADRVLTLRDGALAQDLSGRNGHQPVLDGEGRILLPDLVRSRLAEAERIAVEVRPEGVLLRAENAELPIDPDALTLDMLPQDEAPAKRRGRGWLFGRKHRNGTKEGVS